MEHKNTPGPWEAECRSGDWVVISARDKNAVAWPNRPRGNEVEANVRLIAAAPDLLEALHEAAEYIGDRSAGSSRFWDLYDAAIAKATGSQT